MKWSIIHHVQWLNVDKPPPISVQCFIRYNVTVSDPWISIISAQQLTQKRGEYLMFFFQNYRSSKFTIAQNQTLFFHQFNQPNVQWLSGYIGYYSARALYTQDSSVAKTQGSRTRFLFSYYSAIPENLFKGYFFTARVDFGVAFFRLASSLPRHFWLPKSPGAWRHILFG